MYLNFEVILIATSALFAGVLLGSTIIYFYFQKLGKLTAYIDASGIVETNKQLLEDKVALLEKVKIQDIEISRNRKALIAFAKKEIELKEIRARLSKMEEAEIWRFGQMIKILNARGFRLTGEEENLLTPD